MFSILSSQDDLALVNGSIIGVSGRIGVLEWGCSAGEKASPTGSGFASNDNMMCEQLEKT